MNYPDAMTELEQAKRALADAKTRVEGMAAMGSLELHAAVIGGPSHAQDLLNYQARLRAANRTTIAMYLHVRDLRAAQGLPPLDGRYGEIPP